MYNTYMYVYKHTCTESVIVSFVYKKYEIIISITAQVLYYYIKLTASGVDFLSFLFLALDDGDGEQAHHIHVSIIVDHVAEVR